MSGWAASKDRCTDITHQHVNGGRDVRFDMLRIIAMLMIIACHFISNIGWNLEAAEEPLASIATAADQFLGQTGTSCFFLMSGYFLVVKSFHIRRLIDVIVQTFLYSTLFLLLQVVVFLIHPTPGVSAIFASDRLLLTMYTSLMPVFNGTYWFITAYVLMLVVSPMLNYALMASKMNSLCLIGVLLAVSIMGVLSMSPVLWNNWEYAITGYLIGGWMRLYVCDTHIYQTWSWWYTTALFVSVFIVLACIDYAAEITGIKAILDSDSRYIIGMVPALELMAATALFIMIMKSSVTSRFVQRWCGPALSSTVFGVYLIHNNPYVCPNLWSALTMLIPQPDSLLIGLMVGGSMTLLILVFCSLCSYIFDRLVVYPVQLKLNVFINRLLIRYHKENNNEKKL